jgi:hypothetical protein
MSRVQVFGRCIAAVAFAAVLSGCLGTGRVTAYNIDFVSNYEATIDGKKQDVVCDNKTTVASYNFTYDGRLSRWTSALVGQKSGEEKAFAEFIPSSAGVRVEGSKVDVDYIITPGMTPLSVGTSVVAPQSIVVVPDPKVIGGVYLRLRVFDDKDNSASGRFGPIPVVNNCP